MPTSTLHKSAQQEAPDAYIPMCKSTIQDAHVQEDARVDASSRKCPRRHVIRAWKDTRVGLLARVQGIPTSATSHACRPPCVRPSDARVGHVVPALAFPRVRQRWPRLLRRVQRCTRRLLPERQRCARPRRLQGLRLGPAASIFQATFSLRLGAT